jgi:hypothetical protein
MIEALNQLGSVDFWYVQTLKEIKFQVPFARMLLRISEGKINKTHNENTAETRRTDNESEAGTLYVPAPREQLTRISRIRYRRGCAYQKMRDRLAAWITGEWRVDTTL